MEDIRYLCRHFIDLQKIRIALHHRIRKLEERGYAGSVYSTLAEYYKKFKKEERNVVKEAKQIIVGSSLFDYCMRVRGLGIKTAMEFLGYIDIIKADTDGKARAYCGLVPKDVIEQQLKNKYNREFKGKAYFMAKSVIMHKDEYYYPLWQAKKEYYLKVRGFEKFAKSPELCPRYKECMQRLKAKAKRMGRKPKRPACRKHANEMATLWLASLLISHMLEICRREKDLPYKRHTLHIPPKPEDSKTQKRIVKVATHFIKKGLVPNLDLGNENDLKRAELMIAM